MVISSLDGYKAILAFLYQNESHPPGFYFIGHTLSADGMPTLVLLASVACIPAAWWLALELGSRVSAHVAAALVALSMPLAYYGTQVRPYSIVSLLTLVSAIALVRACKERQFLWRAVWAGSAVTLVYVHYVGFFVSLAEVCAALYVAWLVRSSRIEVTRWTPTLAIAAALLLPAIALVAHQSQNAGYLAERPWTLLRPLGRWKELVVSFPGETLLPLCASLVTIGRMRLDDVRARPVADRESLAVAGLAVSWICLVVALTLGSYRSVFLADYIVLALAPLGMVLVGAATGQALERGRRLAAGLWLESGLACAFLGAFFLSGVMKTDVDLIARYIDAEALEDDLVLVLPGAAGLSLNVYLNRQLSQIDFPDPGPVRVYRFGGSVERTASLTALGASLDSIASSCKSGRRIWFVVPTTWRLQAHMPLLLKSDSFGGFAQAERARANLLWQAARAQCGDPVRVVGPGRGTWGMEVLGAQLFVRCDAPRKSSIDESCDAS
jgi:uncharacterized membrane protein